MDPMESVLHKLYIGELAPIAHPQPKERAYRELRTAYHQSQGAFTQTLSPAQRKKYDNLSDDFFVLQAYEEESAFLEGFRLGVRMMLEVCQGEI